MNSPQLTPKTYAEFVSRNALVAVHFWSTGNGWDREFRTDIAALAPDFPSINFAEYCVDPNDHHQIAVSLSVTQVPFLALYRDGQLVASHSGKIQRNELCEYLNAF